MEDPNDYAKNRETYFGELSISSLLNSALTTFTERLEESMHWLSKLSSIALVIPGNKAGMDAWEDASSSPSVMQHVRWATTILNYVQRARPPKGVQVRFSLWTFALVGCPLSYGGPALETCQALEAALLAFPPKVSRNVQFDWGPEDPENLPRRRAGRPEFWSPAIRSAFPNLNQRGLLALPRSRRKLIYPCYYSKLIVDTS